MRFFCLLHLVILISSSRALGATAGITYYGRMVAPNGQSVVGTSVQFKLQLRTPGSENCLLYEETQTKDLSQTDGIFSITIGDGSGARLDSSGYSIDQVFANRGMFTLPSGQCTYGTTWTPNPSDGRRIEVLFNDGTFEAGTWEQAPPVPINFIPMAIEAMQVGGYKKEQLLKIADGVSTTGTELNTASWTELLALINGTTTQYVKSGSANFTAAPQWNGVPSGANDLVNKTYVDAQVAAGLPNVGTAGTYTKVTTDTKGRVTSGAALVEGDIPTLSTAGKVSGSALNSGTIGGTTAFSTSGNLVTTGTVQGATVSGTNLRAYNGTSYVQLAAPALGSNVNFSLPAADGAAGTLMKTNGAGQLSFAALSGSDIPSLDTAKITTGTLPVARGGTGLASYGNNSVLVSNGTGSAISSLNCALGEVIKFDVSGFAGCGTDSTGSASQWTTAGSDINYTAGKVGIGTTTPASTLEISGDLTFTTAANRKIQVGTAASGNGFNLDIKAGNGFASFGGGALNLSAGNATWSGQGAAVLLNASTTHGGSVMVTGGNGDFGFGTSTGGNIYLIGGGGFAANGDVILGHNGTTARGNIGVGKLAPAAKLEVSGEVKIGETGLACSVTTKGSIRYNNTTSVLEFCNGTGWNLIQAAACTDPNPSVFLFTNQPNATASSLTASDIIQISGINCSVPVTISGQGSPEYQICSDSGCSTVLQGWTSGPSSISNGQYLQTRLTTDSTGGATFQATLIIGSGASVWSVTNAGGDCTGSPSPGTVCADGTIYAGLSPDAGGVKMFTTRCDFGQTWDGSNCTGVRSLLSWNNGVYAAITTSFASSFTGKINSAGLAALVGGPAPYIAALNCENLNVNGNTDWYLPASGELQVLSANRTVIRNFDVSGVRYWSSTESTSPTAAAVIISTGSTPIIVKETSVYVRCVRR
ncbi:MAG: DUF1566 domain-containing protein [Bdellovibrionales bacterium]|nr:DUF1566 domain-containing protein [Bdellovibrionales bacterium]